MKMMIAFKNPKTGEIRQVKCGWSWTLFLWSSFLGLPLFLRKLNTLGTIFMVLWVLNLLVGPYGNNNNLLQFILLCVFFGLEIWLGKKGNEITAKNYLELGWNFVEPDTEFTRIAKQHWGIFLEQSDAGKTNPNTARMEPAPNKIIPADSGNEKFCFKCGTCIPAIAAFCSHCGTIQ